MSNLLQFLNTPGGSVSVPDPAKPDTTVACPFPKEWYPTDSPCSNTKNLTTGSTQAPWYTAPTIASGSIGTYIKVGAVFVALATIVYLATGLLKVYAELQAGSTRS